MVCTRIAGWQHECVTLPIPAQLEAPYWALRRRSSANNGNWPGRRCRCLIRTRPTGSGEEGQPLTSAKREVSTRSVIEAAGGRRAQLASMSLRPCNTRPSWTRPRSTFCGDAGQANCGLCQREDWKAAQQPLKHGEAKAYHEARSLSMSTQRLSGSFSAFMAAHCVVRCAFMAAF